MKSVGTRFLIPCGILAVLASVLVFYQTYESSRKHAYELISQQAALALEFNLAIRDYAAEKIRPVMEKLVDKNTFIPETMSTSFISRQIFEKVEKKFPDYVIRFSSDIPRNPIDKANPDEQRMIEYFRRNPQVHRRTEEIQIEGKSYLAHFSPRLMKQSCLQCHSDPKDAPAELVKRYGPTASFHRKVGDVAGLDTVAVPVEAMNAALFAEMRWRFMILALIFALLFGSIFYIFRFVVARRLIAMASHFDEIAAHAESPWMTPVEVKGNDEISVVGVAFNKLVEQLRASHASLELHVNERTEELRRVNAQLQLELTERKLAEEALEKRLIALSRPLDDPELIDFNDLFNMDDIQQLQDLFAKATGVASIITHPDGTPITKPSNFCRLCNDIIRQTELGLKNCYYSDAIIGRHHADGPIVQPCFSGGLWDAGASITVGGKHIANWLIGQVRNEKQSEENMREYARKIGADEEEFIKAFYEVSTMSESQFEQVADALFALANQLSAVAYQNVQQARFITERKQAEEAFKSLVNHAPIGIYIIQDGKFAMINPGFEVITGYHAQELLGQDCLSPVIPEYKAIVREKAIQRLKRAGLPPYEYEFIAKSGETGWMMETVTPTRYQGEKAVLGYFMDITPLKKLEDQFLQAQKMEAVGTLAGGIAHDFNNILTAILGNIGLAVLDDKIGPRVHDRLTQAEAACLRAQALSQQLLTFAKGGAPIKKLFSVAELLTESTSFTCVGSPVRCETTFPENLWSIEADPGQIGQVFQNLTINAIQAMPTGGTIKVWAENLTLGTDSDLPLGAGRYIKISVRDQGMGIPAEHLLRIFDPYFTTKHKGSGLGLASTYAIIKKHQGHIALESKPGVGTTFHIYLPAVERQVTPQPEEDKELLVGKGKILVMDDEEMVREVLREILARLGYETEFARDGGEAIEMFIQAQGSGQAFAAAILDLTVPGGMGGKEAMERLLKIDPQVKAIVSSGYSDDLIMAKFKEYGFSEVIAKPYRVAELSQILQRVISKKGN